MASQRVRSTEPAVLLPQREVPRGDAGPRCADAAGERGALFTAAVGIMGTVWDTPQGTVSRRLRKKRMRNVHNYTCVRYTLGSDANITEYFFKHNGKLKFKMCYYLSRTILLAPSIVY